MCHMMGKIMIRSAMEIIVGIIQLGYDFDCVCVL